MFPSAPKPDAPPKAPREDREIFFSLKVAVWVLLLSTVGGFVAKFASVPLLELLGVPYGELRGVLAVVLGSLLTTLAVVGWLRMHYTVKRPVGRALGLIRSTPKQLVAGIGLGVLGASVVMVAGPGNPSAMPTPKLEVLAAGLLWAIVLAPLLEEIVFRGVLLTALTHRWGEAVGVLVSTACFAAIHIPDYGFHWEALIGYLWVGGLTSAFRLRTGSLVPAIGLHMAFNATVSLP